MYDAGRYTNVQHGIAKTQTSSDVCCDGGKSDAWNSKWMCIAIIWTMTRARLKAFIASNARCAEKLNVRKLSRILRLQKPGGPWAIYTYRAAWICPLNGQIESEIDRCVGRGRLSWLGEKIKFTWSSEHDQVTWSTTMTWSWRGLVCRIPDRLVVSPAVLPIVTWSHL